MNNDAGIDLIESSGCCIVDENTLHNKFFGVVVSEGEHTISNTKIFGGDVGVAAIAFSVDTVATLNGVFIAPTIHTPTQPLCVGAHTPTQELSEGATAEVVIVPRSGQTIQSSELASIPVSMPLPYHYICQIVV